MRNVVLAAGLLVASSAYAADKEWTPAPTPGAGTTGTPTVMPAARAGTSTGPGHDAPFSGIPTQSTTAGGATSSNTVNDVGTPSVAR